MQAAIADGEGLRQIGEWKGASGIRCCHKCRNLVADKKHLTLPGWVDITCSDPRACILHTTVSLKETIHKLIDAREDYAATPKRLTKTKLNELQTSLGWTPSEWGIWSDWEVVDCLDLPHSLWDDWAHSLLQEDALNFELSSFLGTISDAERQNFDAFMSPWHWPDKDQKAAKRKLSRLVAKDLSAHDRPSSSQYLCFVPVLQFWILTECVMTGLGRSLLALLDFASLILEAKVRDIEARLVHATPHRRLVQVVVSSQCRLQKTGTMKPTNHWLLHIGHQWALAKAIFDTFIAERLHTRSKALCRDIDNTLDFEESDLSRALAHHASSESTCVRDSLARKP